MNVRSSTPEEKLLKIIESPNVEKKRQPTPAVSAASLGINIGGLLAYFKNIHLNKDSLKLINLQVINRAGLIICGALTFIFIVNFFKTGIDINKRFNAVISQTADSTIIREPDASYAKDADLQQIISLSRKHNMFTLSGSGPAARMAVVPVSVSETLNNLKLVGILWSDKPQAMVEDKKESKTYLVNTGDEVSQFIIKKILRDKVIVGLDNQEFELR